MFAFISHSNLVVTEVPFYKIPLKVLNPYSYVPTITISAITKQPHFKSYSYTASL